jgi:hypothetical protein
MKTSLHLDGESERAYTLAREHVLRARSQALFELLANINGTASPSDVRVGLQAAALVRESVQLPEKITDFEEITGRKWLG